MLVSRTTADRHIHSTEQHRHDEDKAMARRIIWIRCTLAALTLWTAAGHLAMWGGGRWATWGTTRFEVPLGFGRSVGVRVVDNSAYVFKGLIDSVPLHPPEPVYRSLQIGLRYRGAPGVTGRKLGAYDVPSWPLLPISTGSFALLLLTFVLHRRI